MKPIFSAAWLLLCLFMSIQPASVVAATEQEQTTGSFHVAPIKPEPVKKTSAAEKSATPVKKRPPIASKSKPASEVVKTELPSAKLDLSLPRDMVQELKPVGTVPLSRREPLLPQMFGDKSGSSPFQLNGRLLNNEMQLQLRNEERREVEGAALDFEFKQ
ncbi:translation initiation factor 2 [Pseudomonas laurylsulfativorans]|uniref:Translation initiation factor 2 n=1 Tax=Pseudomonas laurylsulfativorans TaxID=1943631 RepID=A0A2S3VIK7_9PSED|nr:translation initiation factor 2 [Pseudomonas laurylsulfativorans]POF39808.1 translation initiation factor 2 [Pseudomonas laurylsulfativorans]